MADLTLTTVTVKDGNGTAIPSGVLAYADPNNESATGPVTAIVLGHGGLLSQGQAAEADSIPVVLADDAPLPAGTNLLGSTRDAGPSWTSVWGVSNEPVASADLTTATAVTDAPTGGQKLVITDIVASADTAMSLTFTEETSDDVVFKMYLAANSTAQVTPRGKRKLAVADKKLKCQASVAGNVSICVGYYSE